MQQTKIIHNFNAVTNKQHRVNSMMANSNITNSTESATTNGELNVVSSASLVTATKNQQTKQTAADTTITQHLTTSTTNTSSPQVITVVTPSSSNQHHSTYLCSD